jgi:ubiquinone/menaquinone biosynthesis C-methylase UbiE
MKTDLKAVKWEESYGRLENYIFYPQAEVVKFLNRFIRKKTGINQFRDIYNPRLPLTALDFGCGIGRNVLLFEEFGIKGYGIDISSNAINTAKELAEYFYPENRDLQGRFQSINDTKLPFDDQFFDFAVCDSVLDSMNFNIAQEIVRELDRTVKKYLFVTLIAGTGDNAATEVIVDSIHENGTIQSFFTEAKIEKLIQNTGWTIKWMSLIQEKQITTGVENARYFAVFEKK